MEERIYGTLEPWSWMEWAATVVLYPRRAKTKVRTFVALEIRNANKLSMDVFCIDKEVPSDGADSNERENVFFIDLSAASYELRQQASNDMTLDDSIKRILVRK